MAYEQKVNTGILFKNNKKTTEKHPDYTGKANIDGAEKELSGWVKNGEKGTFLTLTIRDPYVKTEGKKDNIITVNAEFLEDDLLPF